MKKGLFILSIIFILSFISSAILAGKVYYDDLKVYTDQKTEQLNNDALENIYIKSSARVDIYPTAGEPYVEFTQSFIDLVGIAPKYDLRVEEKDKSTYITLEQLNEVIISLGVREENSKLAIYLPQKQIDKLSIKNVNYYFSSNNAQMINLQGIDIKQLDMDVYASEIILDGKYESIDISSHGGSINLISHIPVQFCSKGRIDQDLSGKFESIKITGSGRRINIDSEEACNVELDSYESIINLKGNYANIDLIGNSNNIDLHSETPCKLETEGDNNVTTGVGAFNKMLLKETSSKIDLKTTIIPKKLQFNRCEGNTSIKLTLPSNIPGLNISYTDIKNLEDYYEEYDEDYEAYKKEQNENMMRLIESDFNLKGETIEDGKYCYTYGDKSIPITLSQEGDTLLEIIEGDYTSGQ